LSAGILRDFLDDAPQTKKQAQNKPVFFNFNDLTMNTLADELQVETFSNPFSQLH